MSKSDLKASGDITVVNGKLEPETPMQQINLALKECEFGWFHYQLLLAAYFALSTGIIITSSVPYILPNAECDLQMDLIMKGYLSASPFIGMLFSSIAAGFLIDTFGRKIFLVGSFGFLILFHLISSISQTYTMLLFSKFCEGFLFGIAFSPVMTYTSELCHDGIRDRVMLIIASMQAVCYIFLAAFSWLILIQDWKYILLDGLIVMNAWNVYMLILTVKTLVACLMYCCLPESPRYLIAQHRYDEAREVLLHVYTKNTGKPAETFQYFNLWQDKTPVEPEVSKTTISQQLTSGLHNVKPLFRKPYVHSLILILIMNFLVMLLYNVIRTWYPQLSTIVEHYASEDNQELCSMLDSYTNDQKLIRSPNVTTNEICVPVKSGAETYINSIILGCVCLPPFLITGILVNKVGKKGLLIAGGLISVGATLGLRWSVSKTQVVSFFAIGLAAGQVMMSLLQAVTVELFPTTTRTLAISTTMTFGRLGSLFGNVMFPILLNMGCVVPFFSLAAVMASVTAMALIIPKKKAQ